MKYIELTQGMRAMVDDGDFVELSKHRWYYHKGYAVRNVWSDGKQHTVFMHRLINHTPSGLDTDHINRNKLDNQKHNLRSCDRTTNVNNTGARRTSKSGIKGIYWHTNEKRWRAQKTVGGRKYFIGRFNSSEEAEIAYLNFSVDN